MFSGCDTRHLSKDDVVALNHGYGYEELIVFHYYVNQRWARGISLTWPGVWQHFDTRKCRRAGRGETFQLRAKQALDRIWKQKPQLPF